MKGRQLLREFALLTLGTALVAIGVYFFKFPTRFSTGGVTGIAVLLSAVFPAVTCVNYYDSFCFKTIRDLTC